MRVFHIANTRSTRVLWTLEEIGQPYEAIRLTSEQKSGDEHRRRHPLGRVPVVELDDGTLLFESAAICLHLADAHPEAGLLPSSGSTARGLVYQWAVFAMTEAEPRVFPWLRAHRAGEDETPHAERFAPVAAALTESLARQEWIAGESFTVADIVLASMLRNPTRLGLLNGTPSVARYVERALGRPANRRADAIDET
jgi:glutathione S-transferase